MEYFQKLQERILNVPKQNTSKQKGPLHCIFILIANKILHKLPFIIINFHKAMQMCCCTPRTQNLSDLSCLQGHVPLIELLLHHFTLFKPL
jgi:hypothetical protein